jgi:hypothetical protein
MLFLKVPRLLLSLQAVKELFSVWLGVSFRESNGFRFS